MTTPYKPLSPLLRAAIGWACLNSQRVEEHGIDWFKVHDALANHLTKKEVSWVNEQEWEYWHSFPTGRWPARGTAKALASMFNWGTSEEGDAFWHPAYLAAERIADEDEAQQARQEVAGDRDIRNMIKIDIRPPTAAEARWIASQMAQPLRPLPTIPTRALAPAPLLPAIGCALPRTKK